MYRGSSDKEECKLHDARKLGLYINVTSGCEWTRYKHKKCSL